MYLSDGSAVQFRNRKTFINIYHEQICVSLLNGAYSQQAMGRDQQME
jgi:hypothetical protein